MNHCINTRCPRCGTVFCIRCEGYVCPECKQSVRQPSLEDGLRIHDFRRFSYLNGLLRMFSATNGFLYRMERKGSTVHVWMSKDDRQEHASIDFDAPAETVAEDFRNIIRKIICFTE